MHRNIPGNSCASRSASRSQRRGSPWSAEFQLARRAASNDSHSHAFDAPGCCKIGGGGELPRLSIVDSSTRGLRTKSSPTKDDPRLVTSVFRKVERNPAEIGTRACAARTQRFSLVCGKDRPSQNAPGPLASLLFQSSIIPSTPSRRRRHRLRERTLCPVRREFLASAAADGWRAPTRRVPRALYPAEAKRLLIDIRLLHFQAAVWLRPENFLRPGASVKSWQILVPVRGEDWECRGEGGSPPDILFRLRPFAGEQNNFQPA